MLTGDRYTSDTIRTINEVEMPVVYKPFKIDDLRRAARAVLAKHETHGMGR